MSSQKSAPTTRTVDDVIKGLLLRSISKASKEHSIYGALEFARNRVWEVPGAAEVGCVDLGLDLTERPKWMHANSRVDYLGLRRDQVSADELNSEGDHTSSVKYWPWDKADSLEKALPKKMRRDWFLLIETLDHTENPQRLLEAIGELYGDDHPSGHMLVVTRNARFWGESYDSFETGRTVRLKSRREMRRYFRDTGFQVLDETSPPPREGDPEFVDKLNADEMAAFNMGVAPYHMWVLSLHRTRKRPVTEAQVNEWLDKLRQQREALSENGWRGAPSHTESAELLLKTLLQDNNLEGVHWREVSPAHQLLTARNTGGRLFIIKSGLFGAYHPMGRPTTGQKKQTESTDIRLTRESGDVLGELELFSEDSAADRLYMMSVYALKFDEKDSPSEALVIPAKIVSKLLRMRDVLGNPLLRDLRSKSLEAELGVRRAAVLQREKAKKSKGAKNEPKPVEKKDEDLQFEGRWGPRPPVSRAFVEQIASLLELALENDRARGVAASRTDSHLRRLIVFSNFHAARQRQFGTDKSEGYNSSSNSALQYLEACGVIRALTLGTNLSSNGKLKDAALERSQAQLKEHFDALRAEAVKKVEAAGLDKFYNQQGGYGQFLANTLHSSKYIAVWVESETMLRHFAMDLSNTLLHEVAFAREHYPTALSSKACFEWDRKLTHDLVEYLKLRQSLGLGAIDSLGLPFAQSY